MRSCTERSCSPSKAAIAAAAVVNGGDKKANVLYNVDEGVEEAEVFIEKHHNGNGSNENGSNNMESSS